jgi:hypothetical protein
MGLFSSLAAPLLGAAIGGISGGKNKTSTQSTAPVLPDNVKKGYDLLIGNATDLSKQPYRDITRTRYEPSGMYGGLFDNPEMQALQQASDREYFANMQAPAPAPQPQPAPPPQSLQGLQMRNMYEQPNLMNGMFTPQNTGIDDQGYAEMAAQYASGQYKPTKDRYGQTYLDGNNPFIVKLLRDSQQRLAAAQNASMRG